MPTGEPGDDAAEQEQHDRRHEERDRVARSFLCRPGVTNRQISQKMIGTASAMPPYPAIFSRTRNGSSGPVTISLQPSRSDFVPPQLVLPSVTCSYGPERKRRMRL